jgi:effector-binding domain-containing protein
MGVYEFEGGIPIDRAPDGENPVGSRVRVKGTYGGKALKVAHKGPYTGLAAAHERLQAYAAASGHEIAGNTWDEYASDPGQTPEADLITNIYLPVK